MEQSLLDKFGAVKIPHKTASQFIMDINVYEFKKDDVTILFSECCFEFGEDLRPRKLIDFYVSKGDMRAIFKANKEIFITDFNYAIDMFVMEYTHYFKTLKR